LKDKGIDVSLSALSKDMADRDRLDTDRSVAPLKACEDARILDTTSMGIEEVVAQVLEWAKEVFPQAAA
jgi:cytidylate kinase